jgi:hypothetical protein
MFVVHYHSKNGGYFLYGEGDQPQNYGGTHKFSEAAKFTTKKRAQETREAYLRMSRSNPETSGMVVLKPA